MRLDKSVASVTDLSRSDAKKAVKSGKVRVDGVEQLDPAAHVLPSSAIELDGQLLRSAGWRYFMLHKPEGYVCATKDRQHLTVLDLLDEDNIDKLHIAGRLDIDTTGLVLITDDGQWAHRITSPNSGCKKTYFVETVDTIDQGVVKKFAEGVYLNHERRRTLPAELNMIDEHSAHLTITEGKYHQVKRMFAALGNKVDRLHRERIGDIRLDDSLAPGEYRPLTPEEVDSV